MLGFGDGDSSGHELRRRSRLWRRSRSRFTITVTITVTVTVTVTVTITVTVVGYVIGVSSVPQSKSILLYRGELSTLLVPAKWFGAPEPIDTPKIDDFGQTFTFGDHEVAVAAILYEFDSVFRKRAKQQELELDDSFGGCLKRARLSQGKNQPDFEGISSKTIRRLEQDQCAPRDKTLALIENTLGMSHEEILTW